MFINDKIMFDRYYCINSTKQCKNEKDISALYFIPHHIFLREYAMHDSGPVKTQYLARALRDAW